MKYLRRGYLHLGGESHPARGAWIEIQSARRRRRRQKGRTPHGVRGLKFALQGIDDYPQLSHPARGAWIEIADSQETSARRRQSHPARGAWIEIRMR